jgi:23S rRNA (uracil1939-C5)-methyltransferase
METARGATIELTLTTISPGGEVIGRHAGMVIFTPSGLPGETVLVEIVEQRHSFCRGRIVALITPSPERTAPICQHFGVCGGCTWQHIAYPAQLRFKRQIVHEQLVRIGKLADPPVQPCVASPTAYAYRNHARLARSQQGGVGYRVAQSHEIAAVQECPVLEPLLQEQLRALTPSAAERGDVELRTPMAPIRVGGYDYTVSGESFFQVNTAVAELLLAEVLAKLDARREQHILDLYSGVGLFTLPIAAAGARVCAVESSRAACADARRNLAGFANALVVESTVERALTQRPIAGQRWGAIVLDPPRAGVERTALLRIAAMSAPRIVYVSCDPATLARDAQLLCSQGYALRSVQPFDMFPQTAHVESVAVFEQ